MLRSSPRLRKPTPKTPPRAKGPSPKATPSKRQPNSHAANATPNKKSRYNKKKNVLPDRPVKKVAPVRSKEAAKRSQALAADLFGSD